jgi:hypothetical protein
VGRPSGHDDNYFCRLDFDAASWHGERST